LQHHRHHLRCRLLGPFGHHARVDSSPQCAPKRISGNTYTTWLSEVVGATHSALILAKQFVRRPIVGAAVENSARRCSLMANALLWGARGMSKSSLVKAVHASVKRSEPKRATDQFAGSPDAPPKSSLCDVIPSVSQFIALLRRSRTLGEVGSGIHVLVALLRSPPNSCSADSLWFAATRGRREISAR
jgi:Protein of unknown function (DUF815)